MRRTHLVVCLAVIGLAACAPQRPAVPAAPALRVVVPRNAPPYAFRQENRLVGLEVDFARELAAALGRPLDLAELEFGDRSEEHTSELQSRPHLVCRPLLEKKKKKKKLRAYIARRGA